MKPTKHYLIISGQDGIERINYVGRFVVDAEGYEEILEKLTEEAQDEYSTAVTCFIMTESTLQSDMLRIHEALSLHDKKGKSTASVYWLCDILHSWLSTWDDMEGETPKELERLVKKLQRLTKGFSARPSQLTKKEIALAWHHLGQKFQCEDDYDTNDKAQVIAWGKV